MATRRPRVPKTSQRQLAEVGAGASTRPAAAQAGSSGRSAYDDGASPRLDGSGSPSHPVGGHSAKVIPLDAAPSRQVALSAADSSGARYTADSAAEDAEVDGVEAEGAAEPQPGTGATSETSPEPAPELTPEQRRAEARRALLHRSTPRLRRRGPRRMGSSAPGVPASGAPPATPIVPGTRPSAAARSGTAESERPAVVEPVPARNFTGRSVAFLVVLFVAAVLLAPTLRVFLDQQAELRAVQEDIATERQLEQDLTGEIARWDDPAYIQQQARERFNLVMPGEQTYMVIGGDETVEDPVPAPASPGEVNPDLPWADALWDSVVRAGTD